MDSALHSALPRRGGLGRLVAGCGVLLAIDLLDVAGLLYHKHGHYAAESWFGFQAAAGLVAAAGSLLAGWAGHLLLSRPEAGDA